jgi:hypothetical protein
VRISLSAGTAWFADRRVGGTRFAAEFERVESRQERSSSVFRRFAFSIQDGVEATRKLTLQGRGTDFYGASPVALRALSLN